MSFFVLYKNISILFIFSIVKTQSIDVVMIMEITLFCAQLTTPIFISVLICWKTNFTYLTLFNLDVFCI